MEEIWRDEKSDSLNFFLSVVVSRSGEVARWSAEYMCTNSREEIEIGESIRIPTILRPQTIHQPDRSRTSKKLADSSKPIATRRTLTVLYVRSFQITRCSFRDRVRAFRCRSAFLFLCLYICVTHARARRWFSVFNGRWKCWFK